MASERAELLRPFVEDFTYYAPRALKIRAKSGDVSAFVLNKAQHYLHSRIEDQLRRTGKVRIIGLKGRQQGFSTYVEGRFYWRATTRFGSRVFILTHLQDATNNLFGMARRYHEHVPLALKPSTRQDSTTGMAFDRLDSEFSVATAGSKGAGRSASARLFHGSEMAFWPNAADHMAGMMQIIPSGTEGAGTEIILESTADGPGNHFHQMWLEAEAGEGEYEPVFVPWFWQDEYRVRPPADWAPDTDAGEYGAQFGLSLEQLYWRHLKLKSELKGDLQLFDQEYPATPALAFARRSTEPYVPDVLVLRARKHGAHNVPQATTPARILGVDPAEYGNDSTGIVFRAGRIAPWVRRYFKKGPMEVVALVAKAADEVKPDAINVDCTGVGSGIADRLLELGYPVNRVHFGGKPVDDEIYVLKKDEMWADMKAWLENTPCSLPDDDLLHSDICTPQHSYDSSRRLRIESKEAIRKRGMKSPDGGDALALTFAVPIYPAAEVAPQRIVRPLKRY